MSVYAPHNDTRRKVYTPDQFAAAVEPMREGLLKYASRTRPCRIDDAEDLVAETIRLALLILPEFDQERASLRTWLNGILRIVILRDRDEHLGEPVSVPMIHALPLEACPDPRLRHAVQPQLDLLPEKLRDVVERHLNGFTQREIAGMLRLHPNTVANRLALAGQRLKCAFPDFEDEWDTTEFDFCARHGKRYVRQNSMGKYWRNHHPSQAAWEKARSAGAFQPED